jgi:D-glycero-alpha-D-manno-heptose-7-phosphate kinase
MSFFGGGTDVPEFFSAHGGAVISTTFDKYCYVNVRHLPRFFEYSSEFSYSEIERVTRLRDIRHPAIREAMKVLDMHEIRLSYEADLPARTGLGTSSSFAVGMLNAFYCLKGRYVDKKKLADEAIYLERTLCNEVGGWQDQIAASYGGLNRIDFTEAQYDVRPIIISRERKKQLNDNLMMFFTGFSRFSSEIQSVTQSRIQENTDSLKAMLALVDDAEAVLTHDEIDLDEFGVLLDKSWNLKQRTGKGITTEYIDTLYEKAVAAGALGGKLLGAGGGGFLLFYVPSMKRSAVTSALSELLYVPFEFEDAGSQVVYYSPEALTR